MVYFTNTYIVVLHYQLRIALPQNLKLPAVMMAPTLLLSLPVILNLTSLVLWKMYVMAVLTNVGWNFTSMKDTATTTGHTLSIVNSGKGPSPLWRLNYPTLLYSIFDDINGQYYVECHGVFLCLAWWNAGNVCLLCDKMWNKVRNLLGGEICWRAIALGTWEQDRSKSIDRGDKFSCILYLTCVHHSATLHDVSSDNIACFAHRTRNKLTGTSSGTEGDMLQQILESAKRDPASSKQWWPMAHPASNTAVDFFPEGWIACCGSHISLKMPFKMTSFS